MYRSLVELIAELHANALTVGATSRLSEGAVPPLEAEIAAGFAGAVSRSTGRKSDPSSQGSRRYGVDGVFLLV
jgi:hypothetical protein